LHCRFGNLGRLLLYEKSAAVKTTRDVDENAVQLRIELERTVKELVEFRQNLGASLKHIGDSLVQDANSAFISLSSSLQEVQQVSKGLNASIKRSSTAFEKTFERLEESGTALTGQMNAITANADTLRSASENLNGHVSEVGESANILRQRLDTLDSATHKQNETLGQLTGRISALSNPIVAMTEAVSRFNTESNEASTMLQGIRTAISESRAKETILDVTGAARGFVEAVGEEPLKVIKASVEAARTFTDTVADLTKGAHSEQPSDTLPVEERNEGTGDRVARSTDLPRTVSDAVGITADKTRGYTGDGTVRFSRDILNGNFRANTPKDPLQDDDVPHPLANIDDAPTAATRSWFSWLRR